MAACCCSFLPLELKREEGAAALGRYGQRVLTQEETEYLLFSALPCVAPYCVPGGLRVVSNAVEN